VVLDVDRGIACTWHWISTKYHELVVGCDGFIQKFGFSINLGLSMGDSSYAAAMDRAMSMGPMVGTPSTPEKGCGQ
jgi:hypothetical protein